MKGARDKVRVGIAGGAFDPPHNGHLMMASTALNSGAVDEVWFMPSGNRTDKTYRASVEHRLQLLSLLLRDGTPTNEGRIQLCTLEVEQPSLLGTVELFRELRHRHPTHSFSAIIGSDLVGDLARWRHPAELQREVSFLVIPRGGACISSDERRFQLTWMPTELALTVSSTVMRALLAEGKSVMGLMPGSLIDYITREGLYRG